MDYPASVLHKTRMNNITKCNELVTHLLFRTKDGMMLIPSRVSQSTLKAISQPSAYNTKHKHAKKRKQSCVQATSTVVYLQMQLTNLSQLKLVAQKPRMFDS